MRFLSDGPSIPDELLVARDEGRVVFICGAGVSRACANLPDFAQMTHYVIETLGVTHNDPARKLLDEAKRLDRITGVGGIISADRVFGLLERDFSVRDIEQSVAKVLKPVVAPDLSAHRIMLDLARLPDDRVRIVTTNFDLLFEACDQNLPFYRPPRLPDPLRDDEFEGIIHLHGHVDSTYQGAEGDGLVLSSAGFGRAYLAEGWATSFIRSILDQYIVVFVGYAADDPPVHYLLEALNSYKKSLARVYAFQAGNAGDAEAKWRHKGACPIVYDGNDNHKALWETLAAWATRAKDPNAWFEEIIAMARKGPEALSPHERGQLAHIVTTVEGARKFSSAEDPPPAEWLCVLDPSIRYLTPGHLNPYHEHGPYFDPYFDGYGLDDDIPPSRIDPEDHFARRELPFGAWDAFTATKSDIKNLQEDQYAALRGHWAMNVSRLPARLVNLCIWISKICFQPAAVWWAAGQYGVHYTLQELICSQLSKAENHCLPEIKKAWRFIFEASRSRQRDEKSDWHYLKTSIDQDGWTSAAVREFALIRRPYLTIDDRPRMNGPKPPPNEENVRCNEMVSVSVKYPKLYRDAEIPDEFLLVAIREFRYNLEHAVCLEKEIGGFGLHHLSPIEPDLSAKGDAYERTYGISSFFLYYVDLFKRLLEKDLQAAKRECLAWWVDEETVFDHLRIWVAGKPQIFNEKEAGELLIKLSRHSYWEQRHQRDLLLVLEKRWNNFPKGIRTRLERKLLQGPLPWASEGKAQYIDRQAFTILRRLHWLANHGVQFSFELNEKSEKLRKQAPEWLPQYAVKAADSLEGRGGSIKRETEYLELLAESPETLLQKAKELSVTDYDKLSEKDPFSGLSNDKPELALAALACAAKHNDYPEWAWRTFLYAEARKTDKPNFVAQTCDHVLTLPNEVISGIISPVSDWLLSVSKELLEVHPEKFWQIWKKLITVIETKPEEAASNVVRQKNNPDFATEALNSPIGKLAQALMNDPVINNVDKKRNLPSSWKKHVRKLLYLEGNLHRHALVMFTYNLGWFYSRDPRWTKANLISYLESDIDDQSAFWSGFFWKPRVSPKLFKVLKPYMLFLINNRIIEKQGYQHALSGILLANWWNSVPKKDKRIITNAEMRDILLDANENFRVQIIWHIKDLLTGEKEDRGNLLTFFTDVWPKHKKIKSSRVSSALCELAFKDIDTFGCLVDTILPLISKIDKQGLSIYELNRSQIVNLLPDKVLELLFEVLPDNVHEWPYEVGETLKQIGEVNPSLLKDKKLINLKRRYGLSL